MNFAKHIRKRYERDLTNEKHIALLKEGASAWDEWRKKNPYIKPDLGWANLRGANLSGANLEDVKNLTQRQLEKAKIDGKTKLPDYLRNK